MAWLKLSCLALCSIACAGDKHVRVPVERGERSSPSLSQRSTSQFSSNRTSSLYWTAKFNVGDAENISLLIDTGSTDIVLDPKVYKPSKNSKKYGSGSFSTGFEGVNKAGFGFVLFNGSAYEDEVSLGGFSVGNQAIGTITKYKYYDVKPPPSIIPGSGLIGFAPKGSSGFKPQANPWIKNLCQDGKIDECRFALAYGTSGKGELVIGTVADDLFDGPLYKVQRVPVGEYLLQGDVILNGETILLNNSFIMDVGTDNIQSSIASAKTIFNKLGWQMSLKTGPNPFDPNNSVKILNAFFECDKPPKLGFGFPTASELKAGETSKVFEVSTVSDIWGVYDLGNNNCTSILGGTNALDASEWLLGQSFFSGHYTDFDFSSGTISFAKLKNSKGTSLE